MSNYNNLKTTIDANIKQNGNQEITGPILNSVLNQMVNILGTGYQFAGVATLDPATDPGTPDAKVFYIANGKGTYTNFGGLEVTEDEVVVLYWDSAWHKVATGIASQAKLSELSEKVSELGISIGKEEVDADFEITDKVGNAVVRFKNGHIKTKFFDSSKITTGGGNGSCYPDLSTKTWCSLGTSITWYNNNQGGKFDKGYQGWLMAKMPIGTLINKGVSDGTIINLAASASSLVQLADIYTIEHGVNDWGKKTDVGTISDYINNMGNTTFFGAFRIIIDAIYAKNSKAVIILCTPRKARGFNGYLPSSCNGELDGIKLKDYADAVMEVARYEGLPVCDWFNRCGVNDHNLPLYSIDDALHPNDLGYKQMAQLLIEQFNNIY